MREWIFFLVGSVIGILGLAFGWRFRPRPPKLVFQSQGFTIIESGGIKRFDEEIEVMYRGSPVSLLTSSIVVLWNDGLGAVKKDDIVDSDPVRCCVADGGRILRARVRSITEANIGLMLTEDPARPNEVGIVFHHLNAGDGAVLEVLHTSEELRPRVIGSIVGGSGSGKVVDLGTGPHVFPLAQKPEPPDDDRAYLINRKIRGQRLQVPRPSRRAMILIAIFVIFDAMVAILLSRYRPNPGISFAEDVYTRMLLLPVLLFFVAIPVWMVIEAVNAWKRMWSRRRRFPKGLDLGGD
jgi:hypothetical protein